MRSPMNIDNGQERVSRKPYNDGKIAYVETRGRESETLPFVVSLEVMSLDTLTGILDHHRVSFQIVIGNAYLVP